MIGVLVTFWQHRQRKNDLACIRESAVSNLPGRHRDLLALDQSWHDENTNIFLLTALAGAGKSTLLHTWLNKLENSDWQGAENVYAWSFPDANADTGLQELTDEFVEHALNWFGSHIDLPTHPVERINLLAKLIQRQRTLLVLDNFPVLDFEVAADQKAHETQPLGILMNCLAAYNPGLCVIATRNPIAVCPKLHAHVTQHALPDLSDEAGAELLMQQGVQLSPQSCLKIARNFCGHALTLTLLCPLLNSEGQAGISGIHTWRDREREGLQTRRILGVVENWLWETPELLLLYLISLLDRPVTQQELFTLLHSQRQPWFRRWLKPDETLQALSPLSGLSVRDFSKVQRHLYKLRLVSSSPATGALDVHSLLRVYFRERVKARFPDIPNRLQHLLLKCTQTVETVLPPEAPALPGGKDRPGLPDLQSTVQATRSLGVKLEKSALGKHWYRAAIIANHLCEHHLILGNLSAAVYCARRGVAYAELSHDQPSLIQNMKLLTRLLRLTGSKREAVQLLQRARNVCGVENRVIRLQA